MTTTLLENVIAEEIEEATETMNINKAAQLFGVHPNTVSNWIARGYLRAQKLPSGRRRVFATDVRELSQQMRRNLAPLSISRQEP